MSQLVTYDGYCTWEQIDGSGNLWKITGNGMGTWLLTIYSPGDEILWFGTKTGTLGTLFGDTPEGSYTRSAGCDETDTRDVAPICSRMPANGTVCCSIYEVLISGTGTDIDGLWTAGQFPNQFFWSSSQAGGRRPADIGDSTSNTNPAELVIFSDGRQWILEINNIPDYCFMRFTARMSGTTCPPATGWLYDQDGNNEESVEICPQPSMTISTRDCHESSSSMTSDV